MFTNVMHQPVNHVVRRAIGQDAHLAPFAVPGLHFPFLEDQRAQHLGGVGLEFVVAQIGGQVADGPADVGRDQLDEFRGLGREALDVQVLVQEDGGDVRCC